MFKKIGLILICGALGSTFSFNVRALPISPTPPQARGPNITFVAGGCGIGFHRGPYGACLRNGVLRTRGGRAIWDTGGGRAIWRASCGPSARVSVWLPPWSVWPLLPLLKRLRVMLGHLPRFDLSPLVLRSSPWKRDILCISGPRTTSRIVEAYYRSQ